MAAVCLTDHQDNSITKPWEEFQQGIQRQDYLAIFHLCYSLVICFIILSLKTWHVVHLAEELTVESPQFYILYKQLMQLQPPETAGPHLCLKSQLFQGRIMVSPCMQNLTLINQLHTNLVPVQKSQNPRKLQYPRKLRLNGLGKIL